MVTEVLAMQLSRDYAKNSMELSSSLVIMVEPCYFKLSGEVIQRQLEQQEFKNYSRNSFGFEIVGNSK